jgi:biotin carboxyl carrier protein
VPYLTAVGLLKETRNNIDVTYAFTSLCKKLIKQTKDENAAAALQIVLARKQSLLTRPIISLLAEPHILAGWLSVNQQHFNIVDSEIAWATNPVCVLNEIYHFLNMDYIEGSPAATMIWDHDHEILSQALAFYKELENRLSVTDFVSLEKILNKKSSPVESISSSQWAEIQSAHAGYQAGNEILSLLPYIAATSDFFALNVNDDLSVNIPNKLTDTQLQEKMAKVLVPPLVASSDEIIAPTGGMFYACEAPGMPPMIEEGAHFEAGDPLYIIEVMKMFNKVYAPFSGTVNKKLIDIDGTIISKGQILFNITPDEVVVPESPESIAARRNTHTDNFLKTLT